MASVDKMTYNADSQLEGTALELVSVGIIFGLKALWLRTRPHVFGFLICYRANHGLSFTALSKTDQEAKYQFNTGLC